MAYIEQLDDTRKHVQEIVLIRHGQTDRNVAHQIGRGMATPQELHRAGILSDYRVPLTKLGETQAMSLGRALIATYPKATDCDFYYNSGYYRTRQTLHYIIGEWKPRVKIRYSQLKTHIDLREREGGYPFNMTITQVNDYFPWYTEYADTIGGFYERPPGGESIADVCSRVHMFLSSLRRSKEGKSIFIVAHGGVMLAFRFWLEKVRVHNAERWFSLHTRKERRIKNCQTIIYRRNTPEAIQRGEKSFVRQLADEAAITEKYESFLKVALTSTNEKARIVNNKRART